MVFFMLPEIADHFPLVAIEGHAVFPGFRNISVLLKYKGSQELQTAFCRLLLPEKILVDGPKRHPNCGS